MAVCVAVVFVLALALVFVLAAAGIAFVEVMVMPQHVGAFDRNRDNTMLARMMPMVSLTSGRIRFSVAAWAALPVEVIYDDGRHEVLPCI